MLYSALEVRTLKIKIRRLIAFLLMFIFFTITGLLTHEAGHLTVNNLLGGTGEIFYNYTWTAGHMDWIKVPAKNIWMVYIGGGILTAVFMFIFVWIPIKLTPEKSDVWIEAAVSTHIIVNLLYAPTELFLYHNEIKLFEWVSIADYIAGAIIFFLLYIKIIIKWIDGGFKNGNRNNHSR